MESLAVEMLGIMLVCWFLYLVPLIPVAAPTWFYGQKRVQWNRWDFALAALPFAIWAILMMVDATGKSLSNLVEAAYLGCIAIPVPIVRVVVGKKLNQKLLAFVLLIGVCLVAVGLWAFSPGLPE